MLSDFRPEARQNWGDKVFKGLPVGEEETSLVNRYLEAHDLSMNSRRAFAQDLRKFTRWFCGANREPLRIARVTVRDITDFREDLRRNQGQAVSTVNRCLVNLRRFLGWLVDQSNIPANPAKAVKQLRQVRLAPKGLEKSQVRRLLREIELREDMRAAAIFCFFLYTGARVSDFGQSGADGLDLERAKWHGGLSVWQRQQATERSFAASRASCFASLSGCSSARAK